jgi:hypothetical protein
VDRLPWALNAFFGGGGGDDGWRGDLYRDAEVGRAGHEARNAGQMRKRDGMIG